MGWDPSVLRKYNTTGHFRLLNQLRTELQAHPMPRQGGSASESNSGGRDRRSTRGLEIRPPSYGRGRRFASSSSGKPAADAPTGMPNAEMPAQLEHSGNSFRDRLSAIEMR